MKGINKENAEKIISTLPSFEEKNVKSVTESINTLYTKYESKCGKNIKMSYNIEKIQKLDNSSVENVENSIKQNYKTFSNTIDTIYKVKIKIKVTGDIKSVEEEDYIDVGKIENSWYILKSK